MFGSSPPVSIPNVRGKYRPESEGHDTWEQGSNTGFTKLVSFYPVVFIDSRVITVSVTENTTVSNVIGIVWDIALKNMDSSILGLSKDCQLMTKGNIQPLKRNDPIVNQVKSNTSLYICRLFNLLSSVSSSSSSFSTSVAGGAGFFGVCPLGFYRFSSLDRCIFMKSVEDIKTYNINQNDNSLSLFLEEKKEKKEQKHDLDELEMGFDIDIDDNDNHDTDDKENVFKDMICDNLYIMNQTVKTVFEFENNNNNNNNNDNNNNMGGGSIVSAADDLDYQESQGLVHFATDHENNNEFVYPSLEISNMNMIIPTIQPSQSVFARRTPPLEVLHLWQKEEALTIAQRRRRYRCSKTTTINSIENWENAAHRLGIVSRKSSSSSGSKTRPADSDLNTKVALSSVDIRQMEVDAIVIMHKHGFAAKSGIWNVILDDAGAMLGTESELWKESNPPPKAGDVVVTRGYCLPAKLIFHCCGPFGSHTRILKRSFRSMLRLLKYFNVRTVAIATAFIGGRICPAAVTARCLLQVVREWLAQRNNRNLVDSIIFTTFQKEIRKHFDRLIRDYFPIPLISSSSSSSNNSSSTSCPSISVSFTNDNNRNITDSHISNYSNSNNSFRRNSIGGGLGSHSSSSSSHFNSSDSSKVHFKGHRRQRSAEINRSSKSSASTNIRRTRSVVQQNSSRHNRENNRSSLSVHVSKTIPIPSPIPIPGSHSSNMNFTNMNPNLVGLDINNNNHARFYNPNSSPSSESPKSGGNSPLSSRMLLSKSAGIPTTSKFSSYMGMVSGAHNYNNSYNYYRNGAPNLPPQLNLYNYGSPEKKFENMLSASAIHLAKSLPTHTPTPTSNNKPETFDPYCYSDQSISRNSSGFSYFDNLNLSASVSEKEEENPRLTVPIDDISEWLTSLNLGNYTTTFTEEEITPKSVGLLTDEDLKSLGVKLGARKIILDDIAKRLVPYEENKNVVIHTPDLLLRDVKPVKLLGEGVFGIVYEGLWGGTTSVAMKCLRSEEMYQGFLGEISLLSSLRHPNVVQCYGVCVSNDISYMVTELCNGSLQLLLRDNNLCVPEIIELAKGVCAGMKYLDSYKVVHRDLAARNILYKKQNDKYIVKVADFGFAFVQTTQEVFETLEGKIPTKWSPVEVLLYNRFSSKSDVWSFGITLWEMLSDGCLPYPGMTNSETTDAVIQGYRMPPPDNCPDSMYALMLECWNSNPEERPTFDVIYQRLDEFCSSQSKVSLYTS